MKLKPDLLSYIYLKLNIHKNNYSLPKTAPIIIIFTIQLFTVHVPYGVVLYFTLIILWVCSNQIDKSFCSKFPCLPKTAPTHCLWEICNFHRCPTTILVYADYVITGWQVLDLYHFRAKWLHF